MIASIWKAMLAAAPLDRWALFGASIVITLLFIGGGTLIYLGAWPVSLALERLHYIGRGFLMMGGALLMVIASLTMVSFRVKGPGGVDVEIGRDNQPGPAISAKTTPDGGVEVVASNPPATPTEGA